MKTTNRLRTTLAALSAFSLLGLAACGSDEPDSALAEGGWDSIVTAAQEEGSVTIYSSQGQTQLDELGAAFKEEYGIDVEVVRAIDAELQPKIEAENQTGKQVADVYVSSQPSIQKAFAEQGYYAAPEGPTFDEVDAMTGGDEVFDIDATVLTFGWNTDKYPTGLTSHEGLLDPALKGKIGVPEPSVSTMVDYYQWLEGLYGEDFTEKLAAQDPKIYPSALPIAEALASGEIAAAMFTEPLIDQQAAGAPVDFGLEESPWAAVFYGGIVADGPHPNAAQLLSDFMLTEEGQAAIARKAASIRPDVPDTFGTLDTVRRIDYDALTPEVVTEFQTKWNSLFR
jgi:iron(III) transport system substrate-binding protein